MPQKKYIVRLTAQEREVCRQTVRKLSGSSEKVRRAQVLLKADADGPAWTDQQIADAFSCRTKTVENIRQRCVLEGFEQALERKRRDSSAVPKLLDGEQEARVIALRLGPPPKGYANWSLRQLARLDDALLVAVRQVSAAAVVIVRLVAEHEVGGGQHGSGDRHDGLLRAAPAFEPSKLRLQTAPVLPGRHPRGLDQRGLQPGSRVTDPGRAALPRTLVQPRAQARPTPRAPGCSRGPGSAAPRRTATGRQAPSRDAQAGAGADVRPRSAASPPRRTPPAAPAPAVRAAASGSLPGRSPWRRTSPRTGRAAGRRSGRGKRGCAPGRARRAARGPPRRSSGRSRRVRTTGPIPYVPAARRSTPAR